MDDEYIIPLLRITSLSESMYGRLNNIIIVNGR